ncbi:N-acetylmuramoyl-L-alanine amidase [Pseudopedobacter saltans]|nr:N-acetylmuramoyl-L-alanine amidase [Pseudopedobacter saltans]
MRTIKYLVVHCTATPHNTTIASIMNYWKTVLGWKNPGYHYMIKADGEIVNTFPIEQISNGVAGFNSVSIHIAYIGGIDAKGKAVDNRTPAQVASQIKLLKELKARFPNAEIKGHRDFPNVKKECPCFDVKTWLKTITLLIALCICLTGCKVSRNSQSDKNSSYKSETTTEKAEEKATTSKESDAWRLGNAYKVKGYTLFDFVGKINTDGSLEGSASSAIYSSQEQNHSEEKQSSKEQTKILKRTVKETKLVTKQVTITKTVAKTVTQNIPWWVWFAGAVAIVTALFLQPQSLIVKLKNLIK